jgi:hypothetical protein
VEILEKVAGPYWTVATASGPCGCIWSANRWDCSDVCTFISNVLSVDISWMSRNSLNNIYFVTWHFGHGFVAVELDFGGAFDQWWWSLGLEIPGS